MTEPVEPAETPTAPTVKPEALPEAVNGSRGRRWAIGLSLFTLLTLAGLTATGYWLGWPWVQAQWQRFEDLERQLADAEAAPTEPAPDVAALARPPPISALRPVWRRLRPIGSGSFLLFAPGRTPSVLNPSAS